MSARWDPQVNAPASATAGLDPYFRWAEHTDWRGMRSQVAWDRQNPADEQVQIIVRAQDAAALRAALTERRLNIAPVYHQPIPGTERWALHFSAWVQRADLPWLRDADLRLAWELSQPRRDAERLVHTTRLGRFGADPLADHGWAAAPAENVLAAAIAQAHRTHQAQPITNARRTAKPLRDVVAVIDFGCPFLNPRYATLHAPAATRLVALWDQGGAVPSPATAPSGGPSFNEAWPWSVPASLGHGRHIPQHLLQAMCSAVHAPATGPGTAGALDEADAYRGINYLVDPDDPQHRIWLASHGAHVLDVAGGNLNPLTGQTDAASVANLVFVQLPSLTAGDSSGASLAGHLLDGVRYVLDLCDARARVVINISYGSQAGPHNGTALIESALDELLQARGDNFAIVLAAGNSRQQACHAKRQVRPGRSALLRCAMPAGDTTDTFIETWYPPPPPGHGLQARVRGPQRVWSDWLAPDHEQLLRDTAERNEVVALVRHDAQVPNGQGLGLVVLALAPTAQPAGMACALSVPGVWEIELRLVATAAAGAQSALPATSSADVCVTVNARIERDDPGQNAGAALHRFVDQDADDELDTLSSLATGQHTVVAGGFRLSDGRPTPYSALGPQRWSTLTGTAAAVRALHGALPMVLAACEEDDNNPSVAAAAIRASEVFRMNGTSVAAPVLARQLFNVMKRRKTIRRDGWAQALNDLCAEPGGLLRWPSD
jgi:Subtilase family